MLENEQSHACWHANVIFLLHKAQGAQLASLFSRIPGATLCFPSLLPADPAQSWFVGLFTMTLEGCVPAWFLITSFTLLMFTKHTCYFLSSFLFLKFYSHLLWLLKTYLGPQPAHSPLQ